MVITEESGRFVSSHSRLKINAREEGMSDLQLVLLSQTLSMVSPTVWYNSRSVGLFPEIPESDLVI